MIQEMFGLLCDATDNIALLSHVMFGLGVGTGRAAATSARCSNMHMIMENNFKILQS
jgi:hypothetical protein